MYLAATDAPHMHRVLTVTEGPGEEEEYSHSLFLPGSTPRCSSGPTTPLFIEGGEGEEGKSSECLVKKKRSLTGLEVKLLPLA